jgi:two-component system NtrC family sensor kinase
MPRRLSLKLSLSLTIIAVLIAAVSGIISWQTQRRRILEAMVLGADQLSKGITSATWHAMLADHRADAYQMMNTIAEKQGIDRIRMFNREGQLMFSTDQSEERRVAASRSASCTPCHHPGSGNNLHEQEMRKHDSVESGYRLGMSPSGHRTLNMVTPIYNEPACSNAACHAHPASQKVLGVLDVALRLDSVEQEESEARWHIVVTTLIQILFMAVLITMLTRRFVGAPVQELIEGTESVSAMQLDRPITISNKSRELEALADSFNLMRERLAVAVEENNKFTERLESKVAERTEQLKAAHQKLLHSDRLASLGQLSASVAHEINNPVSGVLNLSMLMERIMKNGGIPEGREEEFRRYLSRITAETSRVGRIVSDLLAFSRRSKPQRTDADLNKLVRSTMSLVAHKLKLNETEVELELAPDLPQTSCDPSQIQQVVLNLVLNASEATHGKTGAKVKVITRAAAEGGAVQLVVVDNGEGIAPENLSKIFNPFFTTKPEGKGVGLGLAVLYGIVQAHDGDVEVTSTPGQGTTFVVTLPLAVPGNAGAQEGERVEAARNG